jgi:F-type H+-transporting ATPase subunit gamma
MATVRELRDRIRSLKNTQQITKAMKQVAAAKIRRAEAAQRRARPYAETLSELLQRVSAEVSESGVRHPFFKEGKPGAPPGLIIVTADKGLAGAFNSNIITKAEAFERENPGVCFYTVGVKAKNSIRRRHGDHQTWPLTGDKLETAREVARTTGNDFAEGRIGRLVLVWSRSVSTMLQQSKEEQLLPVLRNVEVTDGGAVPQLRGAIEFLPSAEFVLAEILPKYLEFTIYSKLLETDAAFFGAQLVAMTNATDNAGKAIDELTIAMNNARQAAITKELLEIVAGAEALTG